MFIFVVRDIRDCYDGLVAVLLVSKMNASLNHIIERDS